MKPAFPILVAVVAAALAVKHNRALAAAPHPVRSTVGGVGLAIERKDGRYLVHSLIEGSPAARSSLIAPGDELLSLKSGSHPEVKVKDLEFEIVVDLIRGEPGEAVELKLRRPRVAAPLRITLVRVPITVAD